MVRDVRCVNHWVTQLFLVKLSIRWVLKLFVFGFEVDTSADVRVSMGIFQQIAESYRKFRNTVRFLLANTTDFDPAKDGVAFDDMESIDKYMTVLVNKFTKEILDAYENYEFMEIYKKLINFITTDLSAFYLDVAKDVVYIEAPNSKNVAQCKQYCMM